MRRVVSLRGALAWALVGAAAAPAAASAGSSQTTFFEAPRDLTAGGTTTESRTATLDQIAALGAKALRVNLRWYDVAPAPDAATRPAFDATNPAAYNWGAYGQVIDAAKKRGWRVLISPSSPVPKWATTAKADTVTRPLPAEFQQFTTALAKRFGGRGVIYSIWNEPNLDKFLKPQTVGGKFVAGRIYRDLFIAGRAGIESVFPSSTVLFGETAPSGLVAGRQKPIAFLRDALCVSTKGKFDKKCGKLTVDGFAHHPYRSIRGIPKSLDDVTYQVIPRLTRALDAFAKAGAINAKRPVYLTEFGIQSYPDRQFGVPQQTQLEERARAEHIAYANPRVRAFSQYLLTDDEPINGGYGGFESGLIDHLGVEKPAYNGFRLVMDVQPQGRKVGIWGLVRPATKKSTIVIERKLGSKFTRWKTLGTASNGVFTTTDTAHSKVQYRYRWTSPTGKLTSPAVAPFKG